jgi:hypothetical protein
MEGHKGEPRNGASPDYSEVRRPSDVEGSRECLNTADPNS